MVGSFFPIFFFSLILHKLSYFISNISILPSNNNFFFFKSEGGIYLFFFLFAGTVCIPLESSELMSRNDSHKTHGRIGSNHQTFRRWYSQDQSGRNRKS